ncbi:hypothetical protein CSUI_003162 [Cystoisospora suis]|uniref:Transmembrane protein n=1 Tax=Cystoisospora suis TaxID=483139 RepID=A0A2C6L6I4_9APIC|nr:hypothetical protein CSUI_003162 [Cystoisospora suis]
MTLPLLLCILLFPSLRPSSAPRLASPLLAVTGSVLRFCQTLLTRNSIGSSSLWCFSGACGGFSPYFALAFLLSMIKFFLCAGPVSALSFLLYLSPHGQHASFLFSNLCYGVPRLVSLLLFFFFFLFSPASLVLTPLFSLLKLQANASPLSVSALFACLLSPPSLPLRRSSFRLRNAGMAKERERLLSPDKVIASDSNCVQVAERQWSRERGCEMLFFLHRCLSVVVPMLYLVTRRGSLRLGCLAAPFSLAYFCCVSRHCPLVFSIVEAAPVWGSHLQSFPRVHFTTLAGGPSIGNLWREIKEVTPLLLSQDSQQNDTETHLYSPPAEVTRTSQTRPTPSLLSGRGVDSPSLDYPREFFTSLRWSLLQRHSLFLRRRGIYIGRGTDLHLFSSSTPVCNKKGGSCVRLPLIESPAGNHTHPTRHSFLCYGAPAFVSLAASASRDAAVSVARDPSWAPDSRRDASRAGWRFPLSLLSSKRSLPRLGYTPVLRQVSRQGYGGGSIRDERSSSTHFNSSVPSLVFSRGTDRNETTCFPGVDAYLSHDLEVGCKTRNVFSRVRMVPSSVESSPIGENDEDLRGRLRKRMRAHNASVPPVAIDCSSSHRTTGSSWSESMSGERPLASGPRKRTSPDATSLREKDLVGTVSRFGDESTPSKLSRETRRDSSLREKSVSLSLHSVQRESCSHGAIPESPGGKGNPVVEGQGPDEQHSESITNSFQHDCEEEERRLLTSQRVGTHAVSSSSERTGPDTNDSSSSDSEEDSHRIENQKSAWLSPNQGRHTRSTSGSDSDLGNSKGYSRWNNTVGRDDHHGSTLLRGELQEVEISNHRQDVHRVHQTKTSHHDARTHGRSGAAPLFTPNGVATQSGESWPGGSVAAACEGAGKHCQTSKLKTGEDGTLSASQEGRQVDVLPQPQQRSSEADEVWRRPFHRLDSAQSRSSSRGRERVQETDKAGDKRSKSIEGSTRRHEVPDIRRATRSENEKRRQEGAPVATLSSIHLREAFRSLSRSDVSAFFSFVLNQFSPQSCYPGGPYQHSSTTVPLPLASPLTVKYDKHLFSEKPSHRSSSSRQLDTEVVTPVRGEEQTAESLPHVPSRRPVVSLPPVLEPSTAISALVCLATYARLEQCEVDLVQGPPFVWNFIHHSSSNAASCLHDIADTSVSPSDSPSSSSTAPLPSLGVVDLKEGSLGEGNAEGTSRVITSGERLQEDVNGGVDGMSTAKDRSKRQEPFELVEEGPDSFYFQVVGTGPPCTRGTKERLPLVAIERLMEAAGKNLSSAQASDLSALLSALFSMSTAIQLPLSASSAKLVAPLSSFPALAGRLMRFARRVLRLVVLVVRQLVTVLDHLSSQEIFQSLNVLVGTRREFYPSSTSTGRYGSSQHGARSGPPIDYYGLGERSSPSRHQTEYRAEEIFSAYKRHEDRVSRPSPKNSSIRTDEASKVMSARGTGSWEGLSRRGRRAEEGGHLVPLLFLPLMEGVGEEQKKNLESEVRQEHKDLLSEEASYLRSREANDSLGSAGDRNKQRHPSVFHVSGPVRVDTPDENDKGVSESAPEHSGVMTGGKGERDTLRDTPVFPDKPALLLASVEGREGSSIEEEDQHALGGSRNQEVETDVLMTLLERICYPPTASPSLVEATAMFIKQLMRAASYSLSTVIDGVMSGKSAFPVSAGKKLTTTLSPVEASYYQTANQDKGVRGDRSTALTGGMKPDYSQASGGMTGELRALGIGEARVERVGLHTGKDGLPSAGANERDTSGGDSESIVKVEKAVALWSDEKLSKAARDLLVVGEAWIPVIETLDNTFGESLGASSLSFSRFLDAVIHQQMLLSLLLAEYQRRTRSYTMGPERDAVHQGSHDLIHKRKDFPTRKIAYESSWRDAHNPFGERTDFPRLGKLGERKRIESFLFTRAQSGFWRSLKSKLLSRSLLTILMITARVPHSSQSTHHLAGLQYALQALQTEETGQDRELGEDGDLYAEEKDRIFPGQFFRSKKFASQEPGERINESGVSTKRRKSLTPNRFHSLRDRRADLLGVLLNDDEAEVDTHSVLANSKLLLSALTATVSTGAREEDATWIQAEDVTRRTERRYERQREEELIQVGELYCSLAAMTDPSRLNPSPALSLLARRLQRELSQSGVLRSRQTCDGMSFSSDNSAIRQRDIQGSGVSHSTNRKGSMSERKNLNEDEKKRREAVKLDKTFSSSPSIEKIPFDLLQRLLISADRCRHVALLLLVLRELTCRLNAQRRLIAEKNEEALQNALKTSNSSSSQIDLSKESRSTPAETNIPSSIRREDEGGSDDKGCRDKSKPSRDGTTDSRDVSTSSAKHDITQRTSVNPSTEMPTNCSSSAVFPQRIEPTLTDGGLFTTPPIQEKKSKHEALETEESHGHLGHDLQPGTVAKHTMLVGKALTVLFKWVGASEAGHSSKAGDASGLEDDHLYSLDRESGGGSGYFLREGGREGDTYKEVGMGSVSKGEKTTYTHSDSQSGPKVPASLSSTVHESLFGRTSRPSRYSDRGGEKPGKLFSWRKVEESAQEERENLQDACLSFALEVTQWAGAVRFQGCTSTDIALLTHALVPLWRKILGLIPASKGLSFLKHPANEQTFSQLGRSFGVGEGWTVASSGSGDEGAYSPSSIFQQSFIEGRQSGDQEIRENTPTETKVQRSFDKKSRMAQVTQAAIQNYFAVLSEALGYAPHPRFLLLSAIPRSLLSIASTPKWPRHSGQTIGDKRGLLSTWKPSLICLLLHCLVRVTPGLTPSISMLPRLTDSQTSPSYPHQAKESSPAAKVDGDRYPFTKGGVRKQKGTRAGSSLTGEVSLVLDKGRKPRIANEGSLSSLAEQKEEISRASIQSLSPAHLCEYHHRWMMRNFPQFLPSSSPGVPDSVSVPQNRISPAPNPCCRTSMSKGPELLLEPVCEPWPVRLMRAAVEELQASVRFPRDVVAASTATASALSALRAIYGAGEQVESTQRDGVKVEEKKAEVGSSNESEALDRFSSTADLHQKTPGQESSCGSSPGAKERNQRTAIPSNTEKQNGEEGGDPRESMVASLYSGNVTSAQASARMNDLNACTRDRKDGDRSFCLMCSFGEKGALKQVSFLEAGGHVSSLLIPQILEGKIGPGRREASMKVKDNKPSLSRPTMFINGLSFREVGSVIWGLDRASTHNHHALSGAVQQHVESKDSCSAGLLEKSSSFSRSRVSSLGMPEGITTHTNKGDVSPYFLSSVWSGGGISEETGRLSVERQLRDLQLTQEQWLPLGASLALEHLRRAGGFCHKLSLYFSACLRSLHRRLILDSLSSPASSLNHNKSSRASGSSSAVSYRDRTNSSCDDALPASETGFAKSQQKGRVTPEARSPAVQQRRRDAMPTPKDVFERLLPGRIRDLAVHLFSHQEKPFPSSACLTRITRRPFSVASSSTQENSSDRVTSIHSPQRVEEHDREVHTMGQEGIPRSVGAETNGTMKDITSETGDRGQKQDSGVDVQGTASAAFSGMKEKGVKNINEVERGKGGVNSQQKQPYPFRLDEKQRQQPGGNADHKDYETIFRLKIAKAGLSLSSADREGFQEYLETRKRQLEETVWRPFRGCVDWRDLPQNNSWLSPPGVTVSLLLTSFVTKFVPGFFDLAAAVVECPMHLLDFGLTQLQHTLQPLSSLADPPHSPPPYANASSSPSSLSSPGPSLSAKQDTGPARLCASDPFSHPGGQSQVNTHHRPPLPCRLVVTSAFLRAATLALLKHAALLSVGVSFHKAIEGGEGEKNSGRRKDQEGNALTYTLGMKRKGILSREDGKGVDVEGQDYRLSENEDKENEKQAEIRDRHNGTGSKKNKTSTSASTDTNPRWVVSKVIALLSSTRALAVLLDAHMHYWREHSKEEVNACSFCKTPPLGRQPLKSDGPGREALDIEQHQGGPQESSKGDEIPADSEKASCGDLLRSTQPVLGISKVSPSSLEATASRVSSEPSKDVFSVFPKSFEYELQTLLSLLSMLLISTPVLPTVSTSASLVASAADTWSLVGRWMSLGQESKEALQALAPAAIHLLLHAGTEGYSSRGIPDVTELTHTKRRPSGGGGTWEETDDDGGQRQPGRNGRGRPGADERGKWTERGTLMLSKETGRDATHREKGEGMIQDGTGTFFRGIVNMRKKLDARDKEEESLKHLAAAIHRLKSTASVSTS